MVTWNPWLDSEPSNPGRWRMVQRKLGRGLDFLISGSEPAAEEIARLDLAAIRPNPFQPRKEFSDEQIDELAASIRDHGVLQPVIVRRHGDTYQLVAGERRFRACQRLGLTVIPAVVREADDTQMLEVALVENIQRADLNPIELAQAYQAYIERLSLTQEQVAARLGKSRPAVANTLRLLDLPPDLQDMVSRGTLTMGHARALLAVGDADLQRALAGRIVAEGWTVRDIEREVQAPAPAAPATSEHVPAPLAPADDPSRAAHFGDLERRLQEHLGTRVRIQDRGSRGRIVIDYYTPGDLERVLDLMLESRPVS